MGTFLVMRKCPSSVLAAAAALLFVLGGCVQPAEDDPTPTESPGEQQPAAPSPESGLEEEGGEVEGAPDAPLPGPESEPEAPAELVAAIEEAVLTRGTASYEATAMLAGIRRANATGVYAFHGPDRIDFTADLEMSDRSGRDRSAEAVALGGEFYLRPPTQEGMPEDTEWVKRSRADFEDPPEPRALYAEAIRSLAGMRDWSMIAGAGELLPAGSRTVNGERARGYRATVAVLDAMEEVGGSGGAWRVLQDLYAQGVAEVTFTVWVGPDYLPQAIVVQMDSDEGRATADLTFSDWGGTVEFEPPPGDLVWERS